MASHDRLQKLAQTADVEELEKELQQISLVIDGFKQRREVIKLLIMRRKTERRIAESMGVIYGDGYGSTCIAESELRELDKTSFESWAEMRESEAAHV